MQAKKSVQYKILFAKMKIFDTIAKYFVFFLMPSITYNNFTFTILDEIQVRFPELVDLILTSESIDNNQKQYWLDILPSMTNEQIDRLFNILMTERQEIERLDLQFEQDVKALNERHQIQWQALQSQKAKEKIAEAEKNDTSKKDADDALGTLDFL